MGAYLEGVGLVRVVGAQVPAGQERDDDPVGSLQLVKIYVWRTGSTTGSHSREQEDRLDNRKESLENWK